MNFLKGHIKKENIILFHNSYCLNNLEQSLTLEKVGIKEKDEVRV